jgi:hypothetical protein
MFTGFSSHSGTLVFHVPVAPSAFGSCMPRYTSMLTSGRWTIKQESMINRNSRSNQSIAKVKLRPRPPQSCALVPAHGIHFPRQNSALRVLLRAPGDLQRRVKQLTDSQDTPCTESLLVINSTRTAHVDHQSGSAHQHCEFPHFPDHAPSHACRKSPNGLRKTCPIIVAVARKIHTHARPSITTINRVRSLLRSITSDQKQHIA